MNDFPLNFRIFQVICQENDFQADALPDPWMFAA